MKLNKITENAISLTLVQLINLVLPLLALPYLARVLGADSLGKVVFAMAISQILLILSDFGFNLSAAKDVAVYRNDNNKLFEIWGTVTIIKIILSSVIVFILYLSGLFFERIGNDLILYLLACTAVIGNIIYPQWLFQGLEQLKYVSFIQILSRILLFIMLLLCVKNETDIYWAVFLQSAGGLLAGFILIPKLLKIFKFSEKKISEKDFFIKQLKYSWIIFIPNIFGNLYLSCNTFFLGLMLPPSLVANYYIAEKLIRASISLCSPISNAFFPNQVRMFHEDKANALASTMKIIYILLALFFTGSFIIFVLSDFIVNLLFGYEFKEAGYLLKLFSPLPILVMLAIIFANLIMIPAGLEKAFSKIIMYSSVVNVFIFVFFVKFLSNYGAVLANILVELIICFSMFCVILKTGNSPFKYWREAFTELKLKVIK